MNGIEMAAGLSAAERLPKLTSSGSRKRGLKRKTSTGLRMIAQPGVWQRARSEDGGPVLLKFTDLSARQWTMAEIERRTPRIVRYETDYNPPRSRHNPNRLPERVVLQVK